MARLHVMERSRAQAVMDNLHEALGKRLAVSSLAPCPVEFTAAYVNMCATQSCGKCTPCRVGLRALGDLLDDVLENRADMHTLELIDRTARSVYLSADCAIGYEAGEMALSAGKVIGIRTQLDARANLELLKEVNSKGIQIYYNLQDAVDQRRDVCKELKALGAENVAQIHASLTDSVTLDKDPRIDLYKVRRVLDKMKWTGWLVVERSRNAKDVRNVRGNFGTNVAYLKEIFQNER